MNFNVSVIIPVYNGARYLHETLTSALSQTHPPSEIIIVDDGSIDESVAIIHQMASTSAIPIKYYYQSNAGPGAARNKGIAQASGDLIAFLDQDDLWLPEKLAHQVAALGQSQDAGYSITDYQLFLEEGMVPPPWIRPERLEGPQSGFLPSCLVVRAETFAHVGLFDPTLQIGNDTDWFVRAKNNQSVTLVRVPQVLARHRVHAENQLRDVETSHRDILQIVHKSLLQKRLRFVGNSEGL